MGRAKLNMELISKEKPRNITFKKRKEGLMRKMQEFTTLCDVSACMIIYPPRQDKNIVEPEMWPQNLEETRRIIDIYKNRNKDSGNKTFGLTDFFLDRKRKIEDELAKLRKKNMEAKYPCPSNIIEQLNESQFREFYVFLNNKAEYVRSRIEMLKQNNHNVGIFGTNVMDLGHGRLMNQQAIRKHLPNHYPCANDYPNSMMVFCEPTSTVSGQGMVDNVMCHNPVGFTTATTVGLGMVDNVMGHNPVHLTTAAAGGRGMVNNVMCHNPMQSTAYYVVAPPVLPSLPVMPGIVPLPQVNLSKESDEQDDVFQYRL